MALIGVERRWSGWIDVDRAWTGVRDDGRDDVPATPEAPTMQRFVDDPARGPR
jgi:hypothetical protein